MRRWISIPIVAVALLALGPASAPAATTIRVGDDFFSPASRTIAAGTKVSFRWVGSNRHNVTKRRGPGRGFASATTRRRGVNFSHRFRRAGVYRLICTIHPGMAMRLNVRR